MQITAPEEKEDPIPRTAEHGRSLVKLVADATLALATLLRGVRTLHWGIRFGPSRVGSKVSVSRFSFFFLFFFLYGVCVLVQLTFCDRKLRYSCQNKNWSIAMAKELTRSISTRACSL
ncbi:uncharacterized protein LOC112590318 [Harpegnathos saltator]|uniref:uncharacterized protein LOC112590318 n=1 Tax=Harpegnathos saltator TaxID=610380 RepID=UPI000DBED2DA|nr:uncharacterized protein LOC112590318 [Harpegnathos saltator]